MYTARLHLCSWLEAAVISLVDSEGTLSLGTPLEELFHYFPSQIHIMLSVQLVTGRLAPERSEP